MTTVFPPGTGAASAVYQAVYPPFRNVLAGRFRRGHQLTTSRAGELACGLIARLAGVRRPRLRRQITRGSWFPHPQAVCDADLS